MIMNRSTIACGLLALAALLSLSGCGQTAESAAAKPAEQPAPASQQRAADISADDALSIALDHAGVSANQAYNVKIDRDRDAAIPIYDVEFETDYGDYDFEIDMHSGDIVGSDYEVKDEWARRQDRHPVSMDEAKDIVLSKVPGASPQDVQIWRESDDGAPRYEGRLFTGTMYYEFEIDPDTGIILDWNADKRK